MKKLSRGVAQMVARMVRDHEAASSSLATPTKSFSRKAGGFLSIGVCWHDCAIISIAPPERNFLAPCYECVITSIPVQTFGADNTSHAQGRATKVLPVTARVLPRDIKELQAAWNHPMGL